MVLWFALLGVLALIILVVVFRFFTYGDRQAGGNPVLSLGNSEKIYDHLAKALTFPTISYDDPEKVSEEPFQAFQQWLGEAYPEVHKQTRQETINDHGLLYCWESASPEDSPIVLLAHYDVVPPGSESDWRYGPFSGKREEGYIWGRGALDDKVSVVGILEAVEYLLNKGYQPKRDIYLAFGFDEETGGEKGAAQIAERLKAKNVKPEFVLDEGMAVTENLVPGVSKPVALIGLAEKGSLNITLTSEQEGGHASMPGKNTAIGDVSKVLARLEDKPMPSRITRPVQQFFRAIAPYSKWTQRLVMANQWLFKPLLVKNFEQTGPANASIRTTMAPTMVQGGEKANTLPGKANVNINARLLPGDDDQVIHRHLKQLIGNARIQIANAGLLNEPTPVADTENEGFKVLQQTIKAVFPEAITAPTLVLGATDARHYHVVAKNIFRFSPIRLNASELNRIHGTDERISEENFKSVVLFYNHFIYFSSIRLNED